MKVKHKPRIFKIKDSHAENSGPGIKVRTSVSAGRRCWFDAGSQCVFCSDGKFYC